MGHDTGQQISPPLPLLHLHHSDLFLSSSPQQHAIAVLLDLCLHHLLLSPDHFRSPSKHLWLDSRHSLSNLSLNLPLLFCPQVPHSLKFKGQTIQARANVLSLTPTKVLQNLFIGFPCLSNANAGHRRQGSRVRPIWSHMRPKFLRVRRLFAAISQLEPDTNYKYHQR